MLRKKLFLQTKVFLFLLLVGAMAVMPALAQKKTGKKVEKIPNLVYPLPPEKPRIRYVGSVSNNLDIEPPKQKGWLQKLINEEESTQIIGMVRPISVAVDSKDRIFVADSLTSSVFVFDSKMKKMDLLGVKGQGRLVNPFGLAIDSKDNVYVSDTALKRVNVYNSNGELIASINKVGNETLTNPAGLAVDDSNNRLLIVDSRAHKIFVSDLNQLGSGESFGQKGDGDSEFFFPSYVAVDKEGGIYISDTLNFCLKVFDKNFKFVRRIGEHGTGMGMFDRPKGIALDSEGHIYVIDSAFSNFQIFNKDGTLLLFVGNYGEEPGFFRLPSGLFIDKHDRIYVADQINRRIQMFQYLAEK
ncbi:MAG TPA: 6-bladed beta-propeller [Pyrinomonadaceae bacterium]|nr:6-bladed beta-propeller [Pyrinomonadaceae bacterium]